MLAAIELAITLQVGDLATYSWAGTGDRICARVSRLDRGPGGVAAAWLVATDGPPHAIAHVQLLDLEAGCAK